MSKTKQKLVIIDSNALIHRAFHALPPLADKDGNLTNAVYGFTTIFLKALKDLQPNYLAACFDLKAKTFRHEAYGAYKATRVKQPDELYQQIPLVKKVLKSFKVQIFEQEGYEADDLIGTIAHLKSVDRPDIETIILTGDQDTLQLVDNNTKVLLPHKGLSETVLYGESEVKEKFGGLKPEQLIDYKGLRGDASDNIPGVKGIGEKGAIELLNDFGSLENIYQNIHSPKIKDRTRELLKNQKEQAQLSKKLAAIVTKVPMDFNLPNCQVTGFDLNAITDLFQQLNFKRLMTQVATLAKGGRMVPTGQGSLFSATTAEKKMSSSVIPASSSVIPAKAGIQITNHPANNRLGKQNYKLITSDDLKNFLTEVTKQAIFAFDTETTSLDPFSAQLLGISFCWRAGEARYLPIKLIEKVKNELAKIFANKNIQKIGHNLKYDLEILNKYFNTSVSGLYFDTMIASYLLNPGHRQHNLDTLAFVEFGYQMQSFEELVGKGKNQLPLSDLPTEKVSWYSCEDVDLTFRLYQKFLTELKKENLLGLLEKLELPLVAVLAEIETSGVKINDRLLKKISREFTQRIKKIEAKIYKLAGTKFNVASPKQLKEILFKKMELSSAGIGKTKTGISTAAGELEKLQGQHPIVDLILEFRELSKLKNTYLDALPLLINPVDGRVHTSFNQTVTATGRLSSSEPNLQNIPIRTETGGQIRKAFIAEKGYRIMKADYSQIELRIVASLANDKKMLKIFKDGGDIHTQTAAFINGIKPEEVTKEIRRTAKEVNFGVLYGIGAWGLASRTGISNTEAQQFIHRYFSTFKGIKKYLAETIELAKETGYVETLYGRRRYLPEINSGVQQVRSAAERMAINMPIQGTAADLIKLAMIKIGSDLPKISPHAKMILQVHDELVFEVPENDVKKVAEFVKEKMC